jgi:FixJ family two-component response regulator
MVAEAPCDGGIEETLARVTQAQRMARVRELLARLTVSEQVVMESLLGGLTAQAIAKKRGCTPQAVDTLRRRAVQKLQAWVGDS